MTDIKTQLSALIRTFENPHAPMIFNEVYESLDQLGKLFAQVCDQRKTTVYAELIYNAVETDDDTIATSPEFVMVLASMLMVSIKGYKDRLSLKEHEDNLSRAD